MTSTPRLIRVGKAPEYLSMSRAVFNETVRPALTEIQIGTQGKAFDRLELDAWVDAQMAALLFDTPAGAGNDSVGNSGRARGRRGSKAWHEKQSRASSSVTGSGTSISKSKGMDAFAKALAQAAAKTQKSC